MPVTMDFNIKFGEREFDQSLGLPLNPARKSIAGK